MYSLPVPQRTPLADFDSIVQRRTAPARTALQGTRAQIATAYANYRALGGNGRHIAPLTVSNALGGYLRTNYATLDRIIRDEILASARHGRCAYCNYGAADTLDHVLPRASYAEFSVLADNLIPVCATCNRRKGDSCQVADGRSVLHPYFDAIPSNPILFVDVFVTPGTVSWSFGLRPYPGVQPEVFDSIQTLFNLAKLDDLYNHISIGEMSERASSLERQYASGGAAQVREYLRQEAESSRRSAGDNYWKTAILQALADEADFCAGGFRPLLL